MILSDFTNSVFINVNISSSVIIHLGNNDSIGFNANVEVIVKSLPAAFPVNVSSLFSITPEVTLSDFTNSVFINDNISSSVIINFGNNDSIGFNANVEVIVKSSRSSFPVNVS